MNTLLNEENIEIWKENKLLKKAIKKNYSITSGEEEDNASRGYDSMLRSEKKNDLVMNRSKKDTPK